MPDPSRPRRRYAIDPEPRAPEPFCRPPAWVLETLHEAGEIGFHIRQRIAMYRVLCSVEIDELDLPRFFSTSFRPEATFALWWHSRDAGDDCVIVPSRAVEAEVAWLHTAEKWQVRLRLYHNNDVVDRHVAQVAGPVLRRWLGVVYPELEERRVRR